MVPRHQKTQWRNKVSQKSVAFTTTQPADWVEAFRRQASLEGIDLSQWVGQACIHFLYDEHTHDVNDLATRAGLSQRTGRGRPSSPQAIPSVSEPVDSGWVGGDGRP